MKWDELAGKTIETVRGLGQGQYVEPVYVLFTDKETMIYFDVQDLYDYHDFDGSARMMTIFQNKKLWKQIFTNLKRYPVANSDF